MCSVSKFISYLRKRRQNVSTGNPAESDVGHVEVHVLKRPRRMFLILDKMAIYWLVKINRESVVGFVIQATGTVEFEDGLRTGVLPRGCWYPFWGRT